MPQDYNNTICLPVTDFSMRAELPKKEPDRLKKWYDMDLYHLLLEKNKDKPSFIFHDGPPYANGDMHIGHALDNILKDFVIRYRSMKGLRVPFIPGWDTHGLPIELQAIKKLKLNRSEVGPVEFRKACEKFAADCVDKQREQRKRLGGLADWEHPYVTYDPKFEGKQIEVFGEMARKGYIYKGMKPVYWCPDCETALAEAEIEYAEDPCTTIYVAFPIKDDKNKLSGLGLDIKNTFILIWTTTPWTLPGNLAVSVNPDYTYAAVKTSGKTYIIAKDLVKTVMEEAGRESYETVAEISGSDLEYIVAVNPVMNRDSLVITGDHVTLDAGTGLVHTAPGFGADDYAVCKKYPEIGMTVPVGPKGVFNAEGGKYEGQFYAKANSVIIEDLKEMGHLFNASDISHQYPHCWRCGKPIIFRATEQWFASVGDFKKQAIEAVHSVKWVPAWGEERMVKMIEDRNDWCISRQRTWGVPIPIFYCENCDKDHITEDSIKAVSELFTKEGSNAWHIYSADEILPEGTKCEKCGHTHFRKESDIMDVWFDSGSSHAAVLRTREGQSWPADVYSEGNDQYRGWFQSSLLTSVAVYGKAPYRTVLTHGMVVDGDGRKMSKSLGNGVDPIELINASGADMLRLWVLSSDYKVDIRYSKEILKQLSESYRKIRNTARFILGNLDGFDPDNDMVSASDMLEIDKFALSKLGEVTSKILKGYEAYEYHTIYQTLHKFCVMDLSNFYLDVIKDRLYIEPNKSLERRSAQSAMYIILDSLVRLMAPALCFTADEIWDYMPHKKDHDKRSVVLNPMAVADPAWEDSSLSEKWEKILSLRDDVKKALELARNEKTIGASLEAKVTLYLTGDDFAFASAILDELKTVFIVSAIEIKEDPAPAGVFAGEKVGVLVSAAAGEKCSRCWTFSESVGADAEHETLCDRCCAIVKGL